MELILALVLGVLAALGAGALSGIRIGGAELGNELAAYMGMLYGLIAGGAAVVIGVALVALV
ncbi:hypothetical protein U879_13175 [Defluviimonas sp. 20V17]|jgi:hypothetical protein|uniref:Uncharacterized protein n=1 Tax=Allgaiera indica TaxID=765699 RepID=A0AAN4ZZF0_9RHOB|nr:hypothetical protein [Allgaiera indica]KDB03202.1 hypothetical protein U879_13175 [Defluviimonas sp. 20V17]GHE01078.1 hypothetical protein GCM10008024_15290 [Allgaiera indica]SDW77698.1 hypothetical protein SAMN05444006_106218 [Allgaiera indica]